MIPSPRRTPVRTLLPIVVSVALVFLAFGKPHDAQAQPTWSLEGATAGEVNVAPELTGHGILLAQAARGVGPDAAGAQLVLTYNTDTLDVTLRRWSLAPGLRVSAGLRGEALIAGLLTDYFQAGLRDPSRGFWASYLQAHGDVQFDLAPRHVMELGLRLRRYFFRRSGETSDAFVLPENALHTRVHAAYVYWGAENDSREWQAHRLFPRVEGIVFRLEGALLVRNASSPWGLPDPDHRDNDVERAAATIRAHLVGAGRWGPLRLAAELRGAYGAGHDDVTRDRLGGLNPYVVRVPGLPWASLISARYLFAEVRAGAIFGDAEAHEVGGLFAAGGLQDPGREGSDELGTAAGVAAYADLRFGERQQVQLHLQLGYAFPQPWLADDLHLSGFAGVGLKLK